MVKDKKEIILSEKEIAKKALTGIETELVSEQVEMLRDYVKGAYRLKNDLEKQILKLKDKVDGINKAIAKVDEGDLTELKALDIPAKYLSEKTVRFNDIDWRDE